MNTRRYRLAVLTLATVAAVASLFIKWRLFPYFSLNHDEAVYLQQAELLVAGQLVLHPPVTDAFRPWFFVDAGTVLYPKYTPVPALLFAGAKLLTGRFVTALPVIAAGSVALTAGVTTELFDRRTGVLAAALLLGSPLFLVQSGVFLPYASTLLLELVFAWAYLRGERTGDRRLAALAGVAIGLAFFARPYTAILFATPFIGHALLRLVANLEERTVISRHLTTASLGSVGVGVALGYNWVITGDPLLFPYQAFAPLDGIGFGHRELLGYSRDYDIPLALASNWVGLRLYATQWVVGGVVGTVCALAGGTMVLWNGSSPQLPIEYTPRQGQYILVGVAASVIVGNIAFWGTLNALGDLTDPDGLATVLGPYYHFDLLLPTTAFAATAILQIGDRIRDKVVDFVSPVGTRHALIGVVLVFGIGFAGITGIIAADAYTRNAAVTDTYEEAYEPFHDQRLEDAVVFVPQVYGPWLNHPFQVLLNEPGFDGDTVYALRETHPFAVVESFPDRDLYRFVYRGRWSPATGAGVTTALEPVTVTRGTRISIPIRFGVPPAYESVSVRVETAQTHGAYAVDWNGSTATIDLVLTSDTIRLSGRNVEHVTGQAVFPVTGEAVEFTVFLDTGTGAGRTYRVLVPLSVTDGTIQVLTPYTEACADPRLCGGSGATITGTLPSGVFIETTVTPTNATTPRDVTGVVLRDRL